MYYMYVLQNELKTKTYVGYTSDLKRRLKEHNESNKGYTGSGKWRLIYYEAYLSEEDARERERKLKHNRNSKRFLIGRIKSR